MLQERAGATLVRSICCPFMFVMAQVADPRRRRSTTWFSESDRAATRGHPRRPVEQADPSGTSNVSPVTTDDTPHKSTPGKWKSVNAESYDKTWQKMAAAGQNPHGEADFVSRFEPTSVLDAGCGSGRVAIELAARGCDVAGVDLDEPFIEQAQRKAPELDFRLGDLSTVDLGRTFDVVVMAGNVMIFVAPGTEALVVARMAAHVSPAGRLIAGFGLNRGLTVDQYNDAATAAGLVADEHWSSWDASPVSSESDYAVLVYRRLQ
jgi:SAM-dependent methyltransferase